MKYTQSELFRSELQEISDVLELINYRPRTVDSYLQSIFECCVWLQETYGISLADADIQKLRAFLLHLKRKSGKLGYTLTRCKDCGRIELRACACLGGTYQESPVKARGWHSSG